MISSPMDASTSNVPRKRRQTSPPSSTLESVPHDGISIAITDDFPADFHVPSRRSVRCRLAVQPTELDDALMPAAVNTLASNVHLQRKKRSTPPSAPDVAGAIAMPPGGIDTSITDGFPTSFHVPSRRSVHRRLAAQPTGSSLGFAAMVPSCTTHRQPGQIIAT